MKQGQKWNFNRLVRILLVEKNLQISLTILNMSKNSNESKENASVTFNEKSLQYFLELFWD
jgi:hypothetical protein